MIVFKPKGAMFTLLENHIRYNSRKIIFGEDSSSDFKFYSLETFLKSRSCVYRSEPEGGLEGGAQHNKKKKQ